MAKKAKLVKFLFGPDLCAHFAAPSIVWSGFFLSAQLGEQGKPDFGGHFMKIVLSYQSQPFQLFGVLGSGGDEVDAGGFDAAVAQKIGQLGHVPADP